MTQVPKSKLNQLLSIVLVLGISLTVAEIALAVTPNPGHDFTNVDGGVAIGDILYGSGTDALSALAAAATGNALISGTTPSWDKIGLTTHVNGILPTANGGTGIAFFTVAGPTVARTYTFPDAAATVLTSNAAVTVAQGGTGLAAITANNLLYGNGTGNALLLAPGGTTGAVLMNTAAGAPSWSLLSALPSTAGALPVVNGGTGLAASVADAVLVGDSTTAYTARTLPASCAGTTAKLLYDSTTNLFSCGTDQTSAAGTPTQYNQSVATPAAGFAADTYLVGSSIAIPANSLKIGTRYHLIFNVSKTAAGTATPILNIRFGTLGTTGDAAKCTLTWTAQTAATDTGIFEVWATFRTVGSGTAAVLQCAGQRTHGASITGLGTLVGETKTATSAGFDSTVASSIIGTSVNGGTSAAWTITNVNATLENLQ